MAVSVFSGYVGVVVDICFARAETKSAARAAGKCHEHREASLVHLVGTLEHCHDGDKHAFLAASQMSCTTTAAHMFVVAVDGSSLAGSDFREVGSNTCLVETSF